MGFATYRSDGFPQAARNHLCKANHIGQTDSHGQHAFIRTDRSTSQRKQQKVFI